MNVLNLLRKRDLTADDQIAIEQAITDRATERNTTRANAAQQLHNAAWADI